MFKWYMTQETNKYRKTNLEIVTEAPGNPLDDNEGPTDYAAAEREMNDANQDGKPDAGTEPTQTEDAGTEDDLGPDDYTDDEAPDDDPETGVVDGEEDTEEETDGGMTDDTTEEEPIPDQNGDKTKNTYLIRDFMNLYFTTMNLIDKINNIKKTNLIKSSVYLQVAKNLTEMENTLYDYIINNFKNNSYVFNLYQFNLFLEVMNVNVEILKKCGELPSNK